MMRRFSVLGVASRRPLCGWTTPPDNVTHDVHLMSQLPRSPIQLRTLLGLFDAEYRLETNNRTYPNAAAFTHDQITLRLARILDRFNHLPYVTVCTLLSIHLDQNWRPVSEHLYPTYSHTLTDSHTLTHIHWRHR